MHGNHWKTKAYKNPREQTTTMLTKPIRNPLPNETSNIDGSKTNKPT
jgi:hypothetical protein